MIGRPFILHRFYAFEPPATAPEVRPREESHDGRRHGRPWVAQGGSETALRQPARPRAPARARTACPRSAAAPRCGHDVPDEKWNDWRWQLSNRVNDLAEIEQILELTDEEREGLSAPDKFRVDVTPYFISLIDPKDPDDPIRRQIIPLGRELRSVHRDDGGLAGRGPPLAGPGPGPPLPRPGPDADHDPVRRRTAATAPGAGSSATRPRTSTAATTRRSSTTSAARRRSATC